MEITSKKSEKILVEEITEIISDLSDYPSSIEENLTLLKQGKTKAKDTKEPLVKAISTDLTEVETRIISLIALSPDNKAIEIYQKKLDKWRTEFEELREQKSTISNEFDQNNPQAITKSLLSLCERIDSEMNFNDSINNPKLGAMLAKFENGLALLKLADTESKYINHFETKYQEWKKTIKRNRFISLISVLGILGIIILWAILEKV
jgi:hypothetical protein